MTFELKHRLLSVELQALLSAANKQGFIFRLSDRDIGMLDYDTLREWRDEVRGFLRIVERAR